MLTPKEKLRARYPLAKELFEEGKASPQVEKAVRLLLDGLTIRQIAGRMGVGRSRAGSLLCDPLGEKARACKSRHFGTCLDCGHKTHNGGALKTPERCRECHLKHRRAQRSKWIIDSMQDWVRRYGSPPSATDWNLPLARSKSSPETLARIQRRHRDRAWPDTKLVLHHFGSWNKAIEAAGFQPLKPGQRRDQAKWRTEAT